MRPPALAFASLPAPAPKVHRGRPHTSAGRRSTTTASRKETDHDLQQKTSVDQEIHSLSGSSSDVENTSAVHV
ncbi:hypothetical protein NDU88_007562 [Pleurodeles waltl]|uniref:Uncharacterized protein n=1 Tax=Pleurodeles waltl TaxID=8319 RepID=A0AAV7RUG4_PLEWA|nr:hypothetical protein NDU88_007562 [Pleurodeles waltl]